MNKYYLSFWFEHGGFCIWGMNDQEKQKYGYPIANNKLPILTELIKELNDLEEQYSIYLNWEYPLDPSPWTNEQKECFLQRVNEAYRRLKEELGLGFEIENQLHQCVEL